MEKNITSYNGIAEDPRTPEQKAKDYPHSEVAMAIPLSWNRGIEGAPVYSLRDQDGSSSCVAQASAKALEILTGTVQSAHPIYRERINYPDPGMYLADAGAIVKKFGTTTEVLDPSQNMSEEQMNRDVTVPTPLNNFVYAFPNVKDIDEVAQSIESRKNCDILFRGTIEEYANSEKPVVIPSTNLNCGHCICGVYYFTDENGVKCILADESWGPSHIKRRILTEDYLRARGIGAMYFIPPATNPTIPKPKFNFTSVLLYGQSNYSIKMLQDILKYEGLFPINIDSTGNYLTRTAKAVLAWQRLHKVASDTELDSLQGKRVGEKTIKALNLIYNK